MNAPAEPSDPAPPVPLGQRLFDNMFLLLAAGVVIVFVLYTGWGLWEITHLPTAPLP
jgi:F0F1-type ATP synthase membrane subunit a